MGWLPAGVYAALQLKQWEDAHRGLHRATETTGPAPAVSVYPNCKVGANAPVHWQSTPWPNRWLHDELGLIDLSTSESRTLLDSL